MGRPMALNLRKNGFALVVHNRSQAAVDALVAAGARGADSGGGRSCGGRRDHDAARFARRPAGARRRHGVLAGVKRGAVIVDMSTISPAVARELLAARRRSRRRHAGRARERGRDRRDRRHAVDHGRWRRRCPRACAAGARPHGPSRSHRPHRRIRRRTDRQGLQPAGHRRHTWRRQRGDGTARRRLASTRGKSGGTARRLCVEPRPRGARRAHRRRQLEAGVQGEAVQEGFRHRDEHAGENGVPAPTSAVVNSRQRADRRRRRRRRLLGNRQSNLQARESSTNS